MRIDTANHDKIAGELAKAFRDKTGKEPPVPEDIFAHILRGLSLCVTELDRLEGSDKAASAEKMHQFLLNFISYSAVVTSSSFLLNKEGDQVPTTREHVKGWLGQVIFDMLLAFNQLVREQNLGKSIDPNELCDSFRLAAVAKMIKDLTKGAQ